MKELPIKPYLIRAVHEWCTDSGHTPYLAVKVDSSTQVPLEFVKDGEIVLNVGYGATSNLKIGNDYIEFSARFGGVSRPVLVPIGAVAAIFARENGQGMSFDVTSVQETAGFSPEPALDFPQGVSPVEEGAGDLPKPGPTSSGKGRFKVVK